jgi:hypothetical protein
MGKDGPIAVRGVGRDITERLEAISKKIFIELE